MYKGAKVLIIEVRSLIKFDINILNDRLELLLNGSIVELLTALFHDSVIYESV